MPTYFIGIVHHEWKYEDRTEKQSNISACFGYGDNEISEPLSVPVSEGIESLISNLHTRPLIDFAFKFEIPGNILEKYTNPEKTYTRLVQELSKAQKLKFLMPMLGGEFTYKSK